MVKKKCANPKCKAPIEVKESDVKRGWGLTCSKACAATVREAKRRKNRVPKEKEPDVILDNSMDDE